jgi:hypothetical protein
VIDTAIREVEAGAPSTAATTLRLALSKAWWSKRNRAQIELAAATCLVEACEEARVNEDDAAASRFLEEAARVIEECALPLAFDEEAASMRLAIHSLRGDSLLAATATAQLGRLDPAFAGQQEVFLPQLVAGAALVGRGIVMLASVIEIYDHAIAAIDDWEAGERKACLKESLKCAAKAVPGGASLRSRYGVTFVTLLQKCFRGS